MRKAIRLLGILDDVDVEWMAREGVARQVSTGTILIHEGVPIDAIYILLDGQLSVWVGGSAGTHIASLMPGEIVGEISFVDARPPVASVIPDRDSVVLMLPRVAVRARLAKDVEFGMRFYRALASFLADRLYVTVSRFGYGSERQDVDVDELQSTTVDEISLGNLRFDSLLKRMLGGTAAYGGGALASDADATF